MRHCLTTLALLAAAPAATLGAQGAAPAAARICLAPATAAMAAGNTAEAVAAVRETFTGYLTGPTLGVAPLTARLASQVREEARQARCPYVLFAAVRHERRKGGGLLRQIAGEAAETGAYQVSGAARSTAVRVAAGAAASAARNLARDVKARDEMTLDYRLERADGAVVVKKTEKGKAKEDGQDLLTPLVERAAEAVAAAATNPPGA